VELNMKIAVASDHRGVDMKARILEVVRSLGHEALDYGPSTGDSVDYPEYAQKVAQAVSSKAIDRGVLICGTGIGMCICANKFDGVRAAPVHDDLTAELSRRHNDANVLCLSADLLGVGSLDRLIEIWIRTEFEAGRHARRIDMISRIETENHSKPAAT